MPSPTEAATGVILAVAVALAACGAPPASPSQSPRPTASASASLPGPSGTGTPETEPSPALAVPDPGRPWDAATLLREMAASTRPDGVPAELQTRAVADAVADAVWTVDGSSWDTFAIGGFCGTATCTLEVAGTVLGRAGEDLWVLEVVPETAAVTVTDATVRSLPVELVEELDALARDLVDVPGDAALATVRWLPPPEEPGRFALSYRSGGEEGSCSVDLVLDASDGTIIEESSAGC